MSRRNAIRAARGTAQAARPTKDMMVEGSRVRVLSPEAAALRSRRVQNLSPNKRRDDVPKRTAIRDATQ